MAGAPSSAAKDGSDRSAAARRQLMDAAIATFGSDSEPTPTRCAHAVQVASLVKVPATSTTPKEPL